MAALEKPAKKLEAQPLYVRVRAAMVERLISGQWKPGQMLPSEFAIAAELGVSQGTVRKALDDMTAQGLLLRKQGKGTFVAEQQDTEILFRFYRLTLDADAGKAATQFPDSHYLSTRQSIANSHEQSILSLSNNDEVWKIERTRHQDDKVLLWERLVLPCRLFPDLDETSTLPNNVYQFYGKRYGIIIARVEEQLRAVAADENTANHLLVPPNTPLLQIDRRAIGLNGSTVEWRLSLCRSDMMHYRNELR